MWLVNTNESHPSSFRSAAGLLRLSYLAWKFGLYGNMKQMYVPFRQDPGSLIPTLLSPDSYGYRRDGTLRYFDSQRNIFTDTTHQQLHTCTCSAGSHATVCWWVPIKLHSRVPTLLAFQLFHSSGEIVSTTANSGVWVHVHVQLRLCPYKVLSYHRTGFSKRTVF